MEPTDITIEILKGIREEARQTNARIDQTNARLDETNRRLEDMDTRVNGRIDALREELSKGIVESEIRTATAITDMHGTLRDVRDLLRDQLDLRPRVERCEHDIDELRRRLGER